LGDCIVVDEGMRIRELKQPAHYKLMDHLKHIAYRRPQNKGKAKVNAPPHKRTNNGREETTENSTEATNGRTNERRSERQRQRRGRDKQPKDKLEERRKLIRPASNRPERSCPTQIKE